MIQKQAKSTQAPQEHRTKVEIRPKFWVKPLIYISGIWFKVIRSEPSQEFTNWLTYQGFTIEFQDND